DLETLIRYLINQGANVNARSYYVGSPLAAAALGTKSSIVEMLLEKEVAVDSEDGLGRRPIHFAALHSIANFQAIVKAKADIEAKDKLSRSALHWAAQAGHVEVIKHIIQLNPQIDIDQRDIDGWTPLCWAAKGGGGWLFGDKTNDPEDTVGAVRVLLEHHADRSVRCPLAGKSWTLLEIASYFGADHGVIHLLKNGLEEEDQPQSAEETLIPIEDGHTGLIRAAYSHGIWCDSCFLEVKGLLHKCKTCFSFDLCQKCYEHLDIVHQYKHDHEFEEKEPEYDTISDSNAADEDEDEEEDASEIWSTKLSSDSGEGSENLPEGSNGLSDED
ncbi:ankyrin repeat-containing domain protein, partial [Daldinia eschscholtzii]